jgi:hypothetical protein
LNEIFFKAMVPLMRFVIVLMALRCLLLPNIDGSFQLAFREGSRLSQSSQTYVQLRVYVAAQVTGNKQSNVGIE